MELGDRIYNLRKSTGFSQEQFGEMLGVSRQSVSKWESNQTQPELQTIIEMSKVFGVSLDSLLGNDNAKTAKTDLGEVLKSRMRLNIGALIAIIGMVILAVWMFTLSKFGDPLRYILYCCPFQYGNYFEIICFAAIIAVIAIGVYISYREIKKK